MDKEKMDFSGSIIKGFHIIKLYKECNNTTQNALILGLLEAMKETDFKRWKRIIEIALSENDTDY